MSEPSGDLPGRTVIAAEPARPEEVAWPNVAAYDLSPREEEVAKLVACGFSTKQISRALFIPEFRIHRPEPPPERLREVGVRSRLELAKRLFFENLYPALIE